MPNSSNIPNTYKYTKKNTKKKIQNNIHITNNLHIVTKFNTQEKLKATQKSKTLKYIEQNKIQHIYKPKNIQNTTNMSIK